MHILIVDDDKTQRDMLQGFLKRQGYTTLTAGGGKEALSLFESLPIQLVLLDHRMDDMKGDEVLKKMRQISPLVRAIMITAYGSIKTAVRVMQLGADDFIEKPVNLTDLLEKIRRIEQEVMVHMEAETVSESALRQDLPVTIVGSSKEMEQVLSLVFRVAPTEWTTLIRGETGTGKELLARMIHLASPRKEGPFVVVNCAAIPENLFESELFGHEKGAFTGAVARRQGRFETAKGGTIFLDEVAELPASMQAKLLRSLQERKINRVGSEKDIDIDVRILAATNRNLKEMVAAGEFREDLFFRLNVLEVIVPPLRERKGDIVELADFFLQKYRLRPIRFDADALAQLVKYDFPGNVRELEHLVQRMVTLVRGNLIGFDDLPPEVRERQSERSALHERLAQVEHRMLLAALESHDWVQTKAAQSLGISERVLRYKMNKAGIKGKK
jgi:two-component system, NtrC family, response regulator AtoC